MEINKWNDLPIVYCISHAREVIAEHQYNSENGIFSHFDGIGERPCRGPFTFCPPPPPLTEEDWDLILDKEYDRYAN
jgi:hypothetical protein